MATNTTDLRRSAYWERVTEIAATSSQRSNSFRRELLRHDERLLIQSTCRKCGAVIVGSVFETLAEDEDDHISRCSSGDQFPAGQ